MRLLTHRSLVCKHCHGKFLSRYSRGKKNQPIFCSRDCHGAARRQAASVKYVFDEGVRRIVEDKGFLIVHDFPMLNIRMELARFSTEKQAEEWYLANRGACVLPAKYRELINVDVGRP